ncbi:hypothetical protein Ahy_A10g050543 isoform C [Arachis hypogaea]|uniref:Uncharacterized protein n=1 Tax=Arachis hypogaea TaxID=3818 RepID=A0A445B9P2_ARAHY|nr:hypothetical protein Ahy_A10g050543 isoform C [Arachis hypogaea]
MMTGSPGRLRVTRAMARARPEIMTGSIFETQACQHTLTLTAQRQSFPQPSLSARLAGLHLVAAARGPPSRRRRSPASLRHRAVSLLALTGRCCLHLYSPSALFSCLLCLPLLFSGSVLSRCVRLRPTYRHSKHPISVPVPCTMWAALQARASVSSWWLSSRQWKLAFSSSSSAVDAVGKCTLDLHFLKI